MYREEWDSGGFEAANGKDDGQSTIAYGRGDHINGATSPSPSSASVTVWKNGGAFLKLFSDVIGKRWMHPADQIVSSSTCVYRYYVCMSDIIFFYRLMIRGRRY